MPTFCTKSRLKCDGLKYTSRETACSVKRSGSCRTFSTSDLWRSQCQHLLTFVRVVSTVRAPSPSLFFRIEAAYVQPTPSENSHPTPAQASIPQDDSPSQCGGDASGPAGCRPGTFRPRWL